MDMSILGFAYDCMDADALADFYVELLGWKKNFRATGGQGFTRSRASYWLSRR